MDTLSLTTVCILYATPVPTADNAAAWQPLVAEAAARFGVPEAWIGRVIKAESGGHTLLNGQPITSRAGAMGLMQIVPQTYAELRLRYGLGPDPYAPRDNILAGAAYLKEMYVRYGYPNLFAAYNAGPGRLDSFLLAHVPLPAETLRYVDGIIPGGSLAFGTTKPQAIGPKSVAPQGVFVTLSASNPAVSSIASAPSATGAEPGNHDRVAIAAGASLFVPLSPGAR